MRELGELRKVFIHGSQVQHSKKKSWNQYCVGNQIAPKPRNCSKNQIQGKAVSREDESWGQKPKRVKGSQEVKSRQVGESSLGLKL